MDNPTTHISSPQGGYCFALANEPKAPRVFSMLFDFDVDGLDRQSL